MKTFAKQAAQGDLLIRRVGALPEKLTALVPENGYLIVAHSETGHHHVVEAERVQGFASDDPMKLWLKVQVATALEHRRTFDTHEPIWLEPGFYEVRRQREYVPEGWRRVED